MQDQLKVTLIQSNTVWGDIAKNLENIERKIESISKQIDLIILPEMFTTGFIMKPETVAETMEGTAVKWMQKMAAEKQCAISGSLIITEDGNYFNRFLFVHQSGAMIHYDKKHLFTLAGEDHIYTAGTNRLLFEYKGWKISPFICYDLRFPVWSRNTENYDIAIYSANWPTPRVNAWDTLLEARAIENMCYCIGVNRVGKDANDLTYPGHSKVVSPLGEIIKETKVKSEDIITVTLSKKELLNTKNKFLFLNDKDAFELL
jgi:predicted amidohydrolase